MIQVVPLELRDYKVYRVLQALTAPMGPMVLMVQLDFKALQEQMGLQEKLEPQASRVLQGSG